MLRTRVLIGLGPSIGLVAMLSGTQAQAQPPGEAPQAGAESQATPQGAAAGQAADATNPDGSSRKISLDDDFLIEGKLEKPSAFYVFRRSDIDYDWARLDARFSPLVLESVQDPLF